MMIKQNKTKVFLVIITILLIANIGMLSFILMRKDFDRQGGGRMERKEIVTNFLKKDIGFTEQQIIQFDTLSNLNNQKISTLFKDNRNSKTEQLKQLATNNFSDSAINLEIEKMAESQKLIETAMINHIKSIRAICTPDQLPKFDSLFIKIFNRRGGEDRKKNQNKK